MWLSTLSAFIALSCLPWTSAQRLTGIQAGVDPVTGERPARLNINDLIKSGPAWDLFIQALAAVQAAPETDWLSWYQIAGIHGIPFEPYNGSELVPGGEPESGYCPHGSITFITWHRPYLALLEQTLHAHAQAIAATYTGSLTSTYKSAAATLRFPYWDWADSSSATAPPITMDPTVTITAPSGPLTVRNPLYSYPFQTFPFTHPHFLDRTLTPYPETKRCINTTTAPDDVINDFPLSNDMLSSSYRTVRKNVYQTFTLATNFVDMASTAGKGGRSFENPHNSIHQSIGGGRIPVMNGHIKPTEWSAFDPIFWLHHANVDRLWALWQAVYPTERMFNGSFTTWPTFGTSGKNVSADTPLRPFVDGEGKAWTSRRVTGTRALGYTYPGLEDWKGSEEEQSQRVRELVNGLYAPVATVTGKRRVRQVEGVRKEYEVRVKVDREDQALALPCSVQVFVGGKLAGELSLLNMPKAGVAFASVSLQEAAEEAGVPLDKTAAEVVDALKGKMRVVVKSDEGVIPPTTLQSLELEIQDRDVTPRTATNEFPSYGPSTSWPVDIKDLKG
ncbi:hypothetical protein B0T16DRAFT_337781 [Cercophora newfieldiana]|uniref:Tyrosinase copper-binding domain-containing protein n=1 Tax=Cercophora newfieldiana TaxID=92897 RepID=A0AA40CI83_9PEZI|nr:hypothetical protein B0T16DRAFT_337781 [Cercophora newfieldiana]